MSKIDKGGVVRLGNIIQPSEYPKIIYELRPNISVYYENASVEINSHGWRSKEIPFKKNRDTVRLVGLGDSFMFGQGVNQNETALFFLEKELNSRFPQKKWEFVNTAVPGYNTTMEVETLDKKALIYKPDIVMLEIIGNDFDLPNFICNSDDYLNFNKSFFIEFLVRRVKTSKDSFKLFDAPYNSASDSFESDPRLVPSQYKDMVGWEGFVKAMMKLKRLQEKNHFIVIIYRTSSVFNERIDTFCKQSGFYSIFNFFEKNYVRKLKGSCW